MRYAGASGFDVHFFNDAHSGKRGLRHAASVRSLFAGVVPRGATPMGAALERLLLPYLATLERSREGQCRPVNFIVITDGAPSEHTFPPLPFTRSG